MELSLLERLELDAVIATLAGCALAWGGLVVPALKPLYNYAWFVGFFASGLLYWALSLRTRMADQPIREEVRAETL